MKIDSCSASSIFDDSHTCEKAFDGDVNTNWATQGEGVNSWIEIKFRKTYRVTTMVYINRKEEFGENKKITLLYSDGTTESVDLLKERTELTVSSSPVSSVRLTVTDVYGKVHNGAKQIEFYGIGKVTNFFLLGSTFCFRLYNNNCFFRGITKTILKNIIIAKIDNNRCILFLKLE